MNTRGKAIGGSVLVVVLAAGTLLVVLNKSLPIDTEQKAVIPPKLTALEQYLANPPNVENAPWKLIAPPNESIPIDLQQFTSGETERKRAVAIGCLAFTAQQMARVSETQDVAHEILEKWIIPNLNLTKILPSTSAYGWEDTVLCAHNAYKSLGNKAASRTCLALLRDEGIEQDDREKAIYLLAYDYAQSLQYQEAIETFQTLPEDSRWADQRTRISELWRKKQADEDKLKQQSQENQISKP